MSTRLTDAILNLGQGPMARPVAALLSLRETLKYREIRSVSVDADGDWTYRGGGLAITRPEPTLMEPSAWADLADDHSCFEYRPRPGEVVVDVGAGIGDSALAFARRVGPTGRVVSIEAHPRTYRCLAKTAERSGFHQVTAIWAAASDRPGVVSISDSDDFLENRIDSAGKGHEVPAKTIDAILAEVGVDPARVTLLKMNIEGAERLALPGAEQLLARIPHVAIACHDFVADQGGPESCRTLAFVEGFLEARGFRTSRRLDDPRPWVREHIYGSRASA